MLVLDDTIVNIALPSIERRFSVPDGVLPWIIAEPGQVMSTKRDPQASFGR